VAVFGDHKIFGGESVHGLVVGVADDYVDDDAADGAVESKNTG
jgi:hypothetical protein